MLKIAVLCIASAAFLIFLKQSRPEFAVLYKLAVLAFIGVAVLLTVRTVVTEIEEIQNLFGENGAFLKILLKALGIAVTAQLAADICRDCGEQSLASAVETTAKLSIVLMALPAAKQLVEISLEWLNV